MYVQYYTESIDPAEGTRLLCLLLGICGATVDFVYTEKPNMDLVYQWSQLEFDYASEIERQADINSGNFIPGKPAPIDTDVYYSEDNKKNKIFISIPRFQNGVPVTLGTVSSKMYKGNPIIKPYPSWHWHRNPKSCGRERIVSVFRVMVDECNRLWVLDTGHMLEEQVCPPQVLAFDLTTDRLLHRFEIPNDQLEPRSLLVTPVVEILNGRCTDTFVYLADCQTFSIYVYDVKSGTSWKATDKTMYPYPTYGTYTIMGDSFDLMDGVLGMALSSNVPGQKRKLFYHAMSSPTENWVYTSDLRNRTRFLHGPTSSPEIFHTYKGERGTQSAAEAIDKDGIMFFGLHSDVKIACWNTRGEYGDMGSTDVVASNPVTLQFASGVKVITNRKGVQELWILTSRFQKIATDTLSPSEINFRIQASKVDDLVYGTNCKGRKFSTTSAKPSGGGYRLVQASPVQG